MNAEQIAAVVYVVGTVISAIILGAVEDRSEDDWLSGWCVAALWPLILFAIAAFVFIGGPFWLGRQIRKILP
jgi:hypothetical protein